MEVKYKIRVLVACEESQAVCIELRKMGIEAYSNDLQECSGGHPEWHIQGSVFDVIEHGWHAMIAFPPCTHLAVSGAAHFEQKRKDGRQQAAIDFFMKIAHAQIKHMAIENPIGIMSGLYRKPNQIIQPYYFGDEAQKTTCLWLKNLPHLYHNDKPNLFDENVTHTSPGKFYTAPSGRRYSELFWKTGGGTSVIRSKTFPGIAAAMGQQWGSYLIQEYFFTNKNKSDGNTNIYA